MHRTFLRMFSIAFFALMMLGLASSSKAQFSASVQGTVTDVGGAVIPGASVTLASKETGRTQQVQTSDGGFYRFSSLAPGLYSITVEKADFKKQVTDNVRVDAESTKGVDLSLEAGVISEVVTVEAENEGLQTEDANVGKTISTREVLSLPQQGRDPYELLRLAPGIFGSGARNGSGDSVFFPNSRGPGGSNNSIFQTENQVPISANGQRVSSNNYQIDGTSVNAQRWGGAAIITPSQESIKELQVSSSTYSAEDGRNSGAQIKVITQNGTNDWHGSVFYKLNDPSLNAFNKFPQFIGTRNTNRGPEKVLRKFKGFGGSVGGPIYLPRFGEGGPAYWSGKDKLFFFFAHEGSRDNTNNPKVSWTETADFRQRVIAARPGTVTAQILSAPGGLPRILELLTPTFNAAANRYACGSNQLFVPAQAVSGGIDFGSITSSYGQYVSNSDAGGGFDGFPDLQCARIDNTVNVKSEQYFGRIDFNATDKDKLAFTSIFTPVLRTGVDSGAQSRPQSDFSSDRLNFAIGAIYIRNVSPTVVNEARFSYSGWGFNEFESNSDQNYGLPRTEIEAIWGDRLRWGISPSSIFLERSLDFRDTFTKIAGNHVLKFGVAFRRDLNKNRNVGIARPQYSFIRSWNFANGAPIFEFLGADSNGKPTPNNTAYHTDNLAFFAQDDWKFRPNLTLNLGVRWEYFSPLTTDREALGNLLLGPDGGLAGAKIEVNEKLTDGDFNNFGPQFGLAWSPKRFDNKLVVRGGFGIGYDRLANELLDQARRNPPASQLFGLCCPSSNSDPIASQILFAVSQDGTIFGYPRHPNIGGGVNPANGLPQTGRIEIYATPRKLPNAFVYRYSLEGQYELPGNTVATLGYQGSAGRGFIRIDRVHITGPSQNPNIFAAYFARPDVNTNFNGLLASLRTRFYKGLNFNINYRFSKSLDTLSFEAPCGCTDQSYPVDQKEEYGPSDFDVRHTTTASVVWDIPVFSDQKSWEGKLLGGWQISSIITHNTGFPWTPKLFGCLGVSGAAQFCDPRPSSYNGTLPDSNSNDNFLRPGGIFGVPGTTIFGTNFDSNNPFAFPPAIGRNRLSGPRYFSTDLSLVKRFGLPNVGFLGESAGIEVRSNFYNVFNSLNLEPFNSNSDPTRVTLNTFGSATRGLSGRVVEFQARLSF
ncbi:hypothetical protein BH20ACI3_BH20ACI3_14520 [soil metagenome]